MADYINRGTAIAKLTALEVTEPSATMTDAKRLLADMPAADVAPVVHWRWEMRPTGMATDTGPEYKAYCTVCNEPNKQYQPPFCPNCGAKMDGGSDNG